MINILEDIFQHWPIIVAIGGAWVVVYATIKFKVPSLEDRIRKIENMEFITKNHCASVQTGCQSMICGKIDAIKAELKLMDKQRQDARDEFHKELKQINLFMGRVEQFMADHIRG